MAYSCPVKPARFPAGWLRPKSGWIVRPGHQHRFAVRGEGDHLDLGAGAEASGAKPRDGMFGQRIALSIGPRFGRIAQPTVR